MPHDPMTMCSFGILGVVDALPLFCCTTSFWLDEAVRTFPQNVQQVFVPLPDQAMLLICNETLDSEVNAALARTWCPTWSTTSGGCNSCCHLCSLQAPCRLYRPPRTQPPSQTAFPRHPICWPILSWGLMQCSVAAYPASPAMLTWQPRTATVHAPIICMPMLMSTGTQPRPRPPSSQCLKGCGACFVLVRGNRQVHGRSQAFCLPAGGASSWASPS